MRESIDGEYDDEGFETRLLVGELDTMLGGLPGPDQICDALRQIQERAQREAELEGWGRPILDDHQHLEQDRLLDLLPLVSVPRDLEDLGTAELERRIEALRAFWDARTGGLRELP
jgi:hypothetical protein